MFNVYCFVKNIKFWNWSCEENLNTHEYISNTVLEKQNGGAIGGLYKTQCIYIFITKQIRLRESDGHVFEEQTGGIIV